jgi:manganese/zinc/iron transport system substrate-binding protein
MMTEAHSVLLRRSPAVLVAAIVGLLVVACGGGGGGQGAAPTEEGGQPQVRVVTTLPIFADFVREAGGDRVEVFSILPNGIDPTLRELPAEDVERIARADLIFFNGLDLETTAEDLLFQYRSRGSQITDYSRDIASPTKEGMSAFEARDNPYLWLDPVLALTYMNTTWDSLVIVDGEATNTYRANSDRYKEQLRALNGEIEEKVGSISPENRKLVTFHDSFFHLANRYGLEYVRLPTPISTDDPSPPRVDEGADLIREQGVRAVFAESGFTSELLTQAAKRAGVEVCTLYSDTLDSKVTTYIEMMRFNADELVRCLGGQ